MKKTISIKCPECEYIRYDLIHLDNECGGLLLMDEDGIIRCGLCGDNFNEVFSVTCPSCGYQRLVDVTSLYTVAKFRVIKMEIFETIIF